MRPSVSVCAPSCKCVHRLKATLERLQRMTQSYVDSLLLVFTERAESIGAALALEPERVQVNTYHRLVVVVIMGNG